MKGISVRLLAILALLMGTCSSALAFDLFGLFSDDEDNSIETLLQSVPNDTVVFFGGHSNSDAAPFFDEYMGTGSEADFRELNKVLQEEVDTPGSLIFGWLLEDYFATATEGYSAIQSRYGMAKDGAGVFYMHGATPVARFAVSDEDALLNVLKEAGAETGAQPSVTEIEGAQVNRWTVTPANAELSFDLAVTVNDGIATLALLNGQDTADLQARRLGLTKIDDSLAKSGSWKALEKSYGFDEQLRGYIDMAGIAESLLTPANTRLGRDLQQLAPEQMAEMGGSLDAVCRDEMVGVARQVPRFVMGGEQYQVNGNSMSQTVRMVLELTNPSVTGELKKLSGSLPSYSEDPSDKLLAFALGIDVNALAPVATALWTQFTTAEFNCATLTDIQAQAQSVNPAMIGMVSGMAQGVKGLGMALYNLEADASSPVGLGGSLLISLSAENPQTVASLISSSVPGMAGLNIPANGDAVEVPVPMPNLPVYAAIKGKHLVVYTGDAAKAGADALASEPLNTRGTSSLALNYQGFGDAMLTVLDNPQLASQMTASSGTGDCTDLYSTFLQIKETPITLSYRDEYTDRGWEGLASVKVDSNDRDTRIQPGQYLTETLDYDCSWYPAGRETLNSDGTGKYVETEPGDQCELYVNEYQWQQKGRTITQEGTAERSRDSCEAEWTTQTAQSFDCSIVGTLNNGFYCLYNFDGEPVLMRYTR